MTQEDKDLLLRDLCGRLSYGVKVEAKGLLKTIADDYDNRGVINAHVLNGLNLRDCFKTYSIDCMEKVPLFNRKGVCNIKPYLFPLSSMTIEEKYECPFEWSMIDAWIDGRIYLYEDEELDINEIINMFDWLNKKHFDYRGLIEMGLAKDATGMNIYKK